MPPCLLTSWPPPFLSSPPPSPLPYFSAQRAISSCRGWLLHPAVHSFSSYPTPLALANLPFSSCHKTMLISRGSPVNSRPKSRRRCTSDVNKCSSCTPPACKTATKSTNKAPPPHPPPLQDQVQHVRGLHAGTSTAGSSVAVAVNLSSAHLKEDLYPRRQESSGKTSRSNRARR